MADQAAEFALLTTLGQRSMMKQTLRTADQSPDESIAPYKIDTKSHFTQIPPNAPASFEGIVHGINLIHTTQKNCNGPSEV